LPTSFKQFVVQRFQCEKQKEFAGHSIDNAKQLQ